MVSLGQSLAAHSIARPNERFSGEFGTVMEIFLTSRNATAAANAAQVVCIQAGICQ